MEEETMEDTVNEEEAEYNFTVYEIDLDYEFDAARFFDFSRDESPAETRQAELWFDSAGSYPPSRKLSYSVIKLTNYSDIPFSAFVAMLVPREDILMENVNISPKSKGVETMYLSNSDLDVEADHEISATEMNYRGEGQDKEALFSVHIGSQQKIQYQSQKLPSGLAFHNHMANNVNSENQTKLSKKPVFPRTSTLMKPTASQLAKQNHPQAGHSRSCVPVLNKTSKTIASICVFENQAAKRQKLDGGHLRKVMGTAQLQQTSFVHKAPKRDGLPDGNMTHTKPRITIPRDPGLRTANRAQRTREKSSKDENLTSTVHRFKALPLDRKILEAPSLLPKRSTHRVPYFQEFHLKTSERALQHGSATLKSTVPSNHSNKDLYKFTSNLTSDCGNREPGRSSLMNNNSSRPDGCQTSHSFKALPLNKKILLSKGDIGIFRNFKKESTVPMEFNFQTEKRLHNNPPIDLFNKLSLACETQAEPKVPLSLNTSKGSKENIWGCFRQGNETKQTTKLKLPLFGGMRQFTTDEDEIDVSFASWSKPIR